MSVKEYLKLRPLIERQRKNHIRRLMKTANNVELIPEFRMGMETKESLAWKKELKNWQDKILKLKPDYILKGNESILELEEIYKNIYGTQGDDITKT